MGASQSSSSSETSIHQFTVKDVSGSDVDLGIYKGKVLLIVNVASKCGYTEMNYTQLSELYNKFKGKDFEILAFPCNQFLRQEPGTSQEAKEFACTRYKAEYPVFQKVRVNGQNSAPVYKYLKASKPGCLGSSRVKWNFTKFLVDKEGRVIARYGAAQSPMSIAYVLFLCFSFRSIITSIPYAAGSEIRNMKRANTIPDVHRKRNPAGSWRVMLIRSTGGSYAESCITCR